MPRRMADPEFRAQQWADRCAPHIAPVDEYVDELREVGRGWAPYVAPPYGGVEARVLSVLRDPGPATQDEVGSGFICVENDDGSAYPWYINRAPKAAELDAGIETILHLLDLARDLTVVLLQGRDADHAWRRCWRSSRGRTRACAISAA